MLELETHPAYGYIARYRIVRWANSRSSPCRLPQSPAMRQGTHSAMELVTSDTIPDPGNAEGHLLPAISWGSPVVL